MNTELPYGPQRIAVLGPNGCGKSTLLKLLAGKLRGGDGTCRVMVPVGYLDQHVSYLDPTQSVLAQARGVNPSRIEGEVRTRLALLGLKDGQMTRSSALLSGGEKMKATLACMMYGETPAQLLLLDEPTNHLDLDAVTAIEHMLQDYRGAIMVVSHDLHFIDTIHPTHRLEWSTNGWRLEDCLLLTSANAKHALRLAPSDKV